jgi:hypothetical protein
MSFSTPVPPLPGSTTLLSPVGIAGTNTPTYTWSDVSGSTWYYVWVDGPAGNVIKQWYTSTQANCNGTICSITPTTVLSNGAYSWKVQTWNTAGLGPWSATISFTVAPPGQATLVSPSGSFGTTSPTYTWNDVSGSTWYYIWVDGTSGNVIKQWYTSADAHCDGNTCWVKPNTTLTSGSYTWRIQTWNKAGVGPWSTNMTFSIP